MRSRVIFHQRRILQRRFALCGNKVNLMENFILVLLGRLKFVYRVPIEKFKGNGRIQGKFYWDTRLICLPYTRVIV